MHKLHCLFNHLVIASTGILQLALIACNSCSCMKVLTSKLRNNLRTLIEKCYHTHYGEQWEPAGTISAG